jgi:hypothetical protein
MFNSFVFRIYVIALVLRLVPIFLARGLGIGLDDMFQYDMLARSLAAGNGFRWYAQTDLNQLAAFVDFDLSTVSEYDPILGIPTSFRAPLYPTFLATVYFFAGTDFSRFFAARLAQAIFLGAPLAPLTYLVSRKLFPAEPRHGLWLHIQCCLSTHWVWGLKILFLSSCLQRFCSCSKPSISRPL